MPKITQLFISFLLSRLLAKLLTAEFPFFLFIHYCLSKLGGGQLVHVFGVDSFSGLLFFSNWAPKRETVGYGAMRGFLWKGTRN